MKRIQELIVVEGQHDKEKLKKTFDCDVLVTSGLGITKEVLEEIKEAVKGRGVILLLDPDSAGNRIRNRINQEIPGCKNAFINKEDARSNKKVGIECASPSAIEEALENVVTFGEDKESISRQEFYQLGLMGQADSAILRKKVSEAFHLGENNARSLYQRLNYASITKEEIERILHE